MALPDFTVYSQLPTGAYMKKSDRSGPYAWDGASMVLTGFLDASNNGTAAILTVTAGLVGNSGAKFDLYNTADKVTNYERLRAQFTSNVAEILTQQGGTGAIRNLRIGIATVGGGIARYFEIAASGTASSLMTAFQTAQGSTGTQTIFNIAPTINQSSTAGATILNIDPTVNGSGSGLYRIARFGWNGTELGSLYSNGNFVSQYFTAYGYLGLGSSVSSGADITLARDAADTLALRRGTNVQTFRVYNTYTDVGNYERAGIVWSGGECFIGTQHAGTGSARVLNLMVNNSGRWQVNGSGYFLAYADNTYDIGASGANRPRNLYIGTSIVAPITGASGTGVLSGIFALADGITAPAATVGQAKMYVDTTDGDLKIVFGDGTVKTIVTDT